MIHVVSGVAIRNGLVLMGKRKADRLRPSMWELPGGKVDPGETPRAALRREWHEELGVEVDEISELISNFTLQLEDTLEVRLYEVTLIGVPVAHDHDELRWVHPLEAARRLPCSPGYYLHFADLRLHMRTTERWITP